MSFSSTAVRQQCKVKPLANTGTSVYNVKVIGGWEKSKLPDSVYPYLIIMKTKRTKEEQFVVELCHAFAKYGVNYKLLGDEKQTRMYLWVRMTEAIKSNWDEIVKMSNQLEYFYND